jgi:hypothetical protein
MKKVVAIILSLALAFPAASLLAQQAPASVKQPIQVAQGGPLEGFSLFGLSTMATVGLVVVAVAVTYEATKNDDDPVVAKAAATTTR